MTTGRHPYHQRERTTMTTTLYHLKDPDTGQSTACGKHVEDFSTTSTHEEYWTHAHPEKVNCWGCMGTDAYAEAKAKATPPDAPAPVYPSLAAISARRAGTEMLHIYEVLSRTNPRLSYVDAWHMAGKLYADGYAITGP
jgi:hypothetical protein